MDILDDFPVEEEPMEPELVSEFMVIIKDLKKKRITAQVYYKRLAKFWEKHGFPEFAEETLLYVTD
jgi:hypothetical protein